MVFQMMPSVRAWPASAATAALLVLVLGTPAEAYIDPGSGSMLMQLLLAGVMGGIVTFRAGLRRVFGLFRRSGREPHGTAE